MRKNSLKILLIVFFALGVTGLGLIISATVANDVSSSQRYEKARPLSLSDVMNDYAAFGIGGETLDKISDFEKTLSGYSSAKNNIVIVDGNGKIAYKLNDNFLHLNSDTMNMACRQSNAVTMDYSNSTRHWYLMRGLDDVCSDTSFGYADMIVIGDLKTPADDVRNMLDVYDGKSSEANLSICSISNGSEYPYGEDSNGNMAVPTSAPSDKVSPEKAQYLLWFRDAAMDAAISKALGPDYFDFYLYATRIGSLLLILYWLLAPVYVFIDARRRKTQPLPWALLVLLTNLVGLAVYWIYQAQNAKASPVCPSCGKSVSKGHLYCPWCAEPLVKACKGCGKALEREWVACPYCGKPVD